MTNREFNPNEQYCDTTGAPYAGGTLYFYASGTSTLLSTYSNQALSIANTNPVVLDSAGRAGNIFLQNFAYKVVLSDVNNNQIWTADPVYTSDFSVTAQVLTYFGNPNGFVSGVAGFGTVPSSVLWDRQNNILYVCTTTGNAAGAIWTSTNSSTQASFSTGDGKLTLKNVADSGWVLADDGTIGSTGSGGTTRANVDTQALFVLLWTNVPNTYAPVSGGRGASGLADFNGLKTIGLTKQLGRALTIAGTGSGLTARVLGQTLGEETHALSTSEVPNLSVSVSGTPSGSVSISDTRTWSTPSTNTGSASSGVAIASAQAASGAITTSVSSGSISGSFSGNSLSSTGNTSSGGGGSHNNMQPSSSWNIMIKL